VVGARDDACASGQLDPECRLGGLPVREDRGRNILPGTALPYRAVYAIANPQLGELFGVSAGEQHSRIAGQAVGARVTAAAVHVDGPPERHSGAGGDLVEDALGRDVQELQRGQLTGATLRTG
jgi:hypothetical protein